MTASPHLLQDDVDLRELVRVAWRSRFWLLFIALISGVAAGWWGTKIPESYLVEILLKVEKPAHANYTKEELFDIFGSDAVLVPVAEKYGIGVDVLRGSLNIGRKKKPVLRENGSFSWVFYLSITFDSDRKDSSKILTEVISLFKQAVQRHVEALATESTVENWQPPGDWITTVESTTQVTKTNPWKALTFGTLVALILGLIGVFGIHFLRGDVQEKS